jgi:hypothetical protein
VRVWTTPTTPADIALIEVKIAGGATIGSSSTIVSGLYADIALTTPQHITSTPQNYEVHFDLTASAWPDDVVKAQLLTATDVTVTSPNPPVPPVLGTFPISCQHTVSVELSSFEAIPGDGEITVRWVTESSVDNVGFNLYRSLSPDGEYVRLNPDLIEGIGTSVSPRTYTYTDGEVTDGETYWYRLEDVDIQGRTGAAGPVLVTLSPSVDVEAEAATHAPAKFALGRNVPNPFNPATTITYDLPEASNVRLTIYNLSGQQVATLVSFAYQAAGHYEVTWDGSDFATGVYFYRLEAGNFADTQRMVLLK